MAKILFQGDSITDAQRNPRDLSADRISSLGAGYVTMISAQLGLTPGNEWQVVNRGVSGDCVEDMSKRWQKCLEEVKPDWVSVLIGINDTWHRRIYPEGDASAVDLAKGLPPLDFARVLEGLLTETLQAQPKLRITLMEPFAFPIGVVQEAWLTEIQERQAFCEEIAKSLERLKHDIIWVPLQAAFDQAAEQVGQSTLLYDGVHPTPAGHQLICQQWISAVNDAGAE